MATHEVLPTRETVHGPFDVSRPPILTIDPGDTVRYETLDAGWGRHNAAIGVRPLQFEVPPEEAQGHALSGPIAVRGARPGDVLQIEIGHIRPGSWGTSWTGPRPWMKRYDFHLEQETELVWDIDAERRQAVTRDEPRLEIGLRPFMGVMGNAPGAPGPHSTTPPRAVGGNIDCRELVPGSTLWLPIEADGALFSVGDGHAVQADGEVGQTAIECPMERLDLTFSVRRDLRLSMPEADTPAGYVTFGFADSLDVAANIAMNRMLDHLEEEFGLARPRAMALSSLAVHLRITQIVNEVSGVHALLPHDAFGIAGRSPRGAGSGY